ncbi:DUF5994 family protein [Nocardia xishanensis]|uniref:DUF5994 family protein n=1 Tax=Nocardia xishanensis TaxID=238964 RepID=UPI001FE172DB|nr:DUF5994 family protein [Nocardia xishanensis]
MAELPDLLAVLGGQLGPIHRVIYHLDEWTRQTRQRWATGPARRLPAQACAHHRCPRGQRRQAHRTSRACVHR